MSYAPVTIAPLTPEDRAIYAGLSLAGQLAVSASYEQAHEWPANLPALRAVVGNRLTVAQMVTNQINETDEGDAE